MPDHEPTDPNPVPRGASSAGGSDAERGLERMRALLDRPLPPERLAENTTLVAAPAAREAGDSASLLVFGIGDELLAVEAEGMHRVFRVSPVRRIPHRSNAVLAGLANIGGELTLVADLAAALGLSPGGAATHFVVVGEPSARWAFGVDRVDGVRRVERARLLPAPATVRHAADGCTVAIAPGEDGGPPVSVLDVRRVCALLGRSLA
jgi:chemotaxis-related protein WspD